MELPKKLIFLLLMSLASLEAKPPPTHPGQMLFLMRSGKTERAIDAYRAYVDYTEEQQFDLLHEMAWALIEQGARSDDPEVLLLSLFGASLSNDEQALGVLIRSLNAPNPQVQLAAIHFLAKMHHDIADKEITSGMASNELLIRLETLLLMAEKKMPDFCLQGEALMNKIPKQIYCLFPPLFAQCGDAASLKKLRKFLSDPDDKVRAAAIIGVEQTKREEFLPQVRRLSKHIHPLVQETAASCLGTLKDDHGREHLERLSHSAIKEVRLAALKSLWELGDRSSAEEIFKEARDGNLFAVCLLGKVDGYNDFLAHNSRHPEAVVRLNAAFALLAKKDRRCIEPILPFLMEDSDNWAILPNVSQGKSLQYLKRVASARELAEENDSVSMEVGLRTKEVLLAQMMDLPERDFLFVAEELLRHNCKPLLPTLVQLLEQYHSDRAIALLKKYHQKVGAPLVRQLCSLGLFRMGVEGPYKEEIRFRPVLAASQEPLEATYQLTPEEISRILVESLESLVQMQDNDVIDILLEAIQHGHEKNRYALAGVIIRAMM